MDTAKDRASFFYTQKTSAEGIYAAADICIKPLRQVVTATADGALAATVLEKYAAAMQQKTGLIPLSPGQRNPPANHAGTSALFPSESGIFTPDMAQQLQGLFQRMEHGLLLKLSLDHRPVSAELESYMTALARLTEKLRIQVTDREASSQWAPVVEIYREGGTPTGLAFHGVPAGHEFTSFVLGLYNAAGPGQPLEPAIREKINSISSPVDLKILVTLSCTLCPNLVVAAQRIAASNPNVTAHIYDLRHFESLRAQNLAMSVPCLVLDSDKVSFGKKNIGQLLDLIGK